MVCSINQDLFQQKPLRKSNSKFKPKSWTENIESYFSVANQLRTCLYLNHKIHHRSFHWFLTIYFWKRQSPSEITENWKKIARKLNQNGIVAVWIRETTKTNKIHYHLVIVNRISRKSLENIIENSLPSRRLIGRWHKRILEVRPKTEWPLLSYFVKAKVSGFVKGKYTNDKYAKKRFLFRSNLGLRKHGTIGKFWGLPMKQIWKTLQEREAKIAKGLSDKKVLELGAKLYDECLFTIKGMTKEKAQRNIAFWYDSSETERWIDDFDKTGELFSWIGSGDSQNL